LALNIYFDASVIVALFANDPFANRLQKAMRSRSITPVVSDFAAAEFASAIARIVRMKQLAEKEARDIFSLFDAWVARSAVRILSSAEDIRMATNVLRRLDLNLRAPDAIHIAIAQRLDIELATFDARMSDCAKSFGVTPSKI
jgi:predicted nucleic acid-binding protein